MIEAPRHDDAVPPEMLEGELETLRTEGSPLVAVTDRPAQLGDFVELDFRGRDAEGGELPGAFAEGSWGRRAVVERTTSRRRCLPRRKPRRC